MGVNPFPEDDPHHDEWEQQEAGDPTPGPPEVIPAPFNPMAVARHIMTTRTVGKYMTLRRWNDAWMRWDGPQWSEVSDAAVKAEIYPILERAVWEAVDDKGDTKLKPWLPNRRKVADLMETLHAVTHLDDSTEAPSWLGGPGTKGPWTGHGPGMDRGASDTFPQAGSFGPGGPGGIGKLAPIVACSNGLLDVGTRVLYPHTPAYFNLASVPFDYNPAAPAPVEWLKFLESIWGDDAEAVGTLQEFFGYVVSGRTEQQKALFIVGKKRSGKGTITRVLEALVGKANVASTTTSALAGDFGLQGLLGKSLAVFPDIRAALDGSEVVMERLLSITANDPIDVQRKHQTPWNGRLPARLIMMSNDLLPFRDSSGTLNSRFIVLILTRSFFGMEDTGLGDRLLGELPGIFNWALEGLDRLTKRGSFMEPESSATAVAAMASVASPVQGFLEDMCIVAPGYEVAKDHLFAAWKKWCEDEGHMPGSKANLGKLLFSAAPEVKETRPYENGTKVRKYWGIALMTPEMRHGQDEEQRVRATNGESARSTGSSGPKYGSDQQKQWTGQPGPQPGPKPGSEPLCPCGRERHAPGDWDTCASGHLFHRYGKGGSSRCRQCETKEK